MTATNLTSGKAESTGYEETRNYPSEIVRILDKWQKGSDAIHFCALVGKDEDETLGVLVDRAMAQIGAHK